MPHDARIEELFGPIQSVAGPSYTWRGRDTARLRDRAIWRRFLRERSLSAEELRLLRQIFTESRRSSQALAEGAPGWLWDVAERDWILDVLEIEVDLRHNGRAILTGPEPPPGSTAHDPYTVEIRWELGRAPSLPRIRSVQILAEEHLHPHSPPPGLDPYWAAFALSLGREPEGTFRRMPRRRPHPGAALDTDFYERVLASYGELRKEGYRDPAGELARRMKAKPSTVKSWLRRGRIYLEGGKP